MKNLWQSVCKLHARFVAVASYLQSPFLLLFVRVYWGWEFAEDGWGKIHNLGKVTDYFASLNLPMPGQTALFVSVVELVGGVLLILGLLSRLTGLVLTVNMTVAFLSVEGDRAALFFRLHRPGQILRCDALRVSFCLARDTHFRTGKILARLVDYAQGSRVASNIRRDAAKPLWPVKRE